ncbi:hypothetical protein [Pseudonocardia sp. ICBG1293]|uniref:hypothetical protein n=1 Tax=Pseudonocardia sp. ICBG1293 TaxID=2844382 RepID=UPI001CD032A7|nr:hypothetical protein [Pseudonocardia sp. ICBG1293]
MTTRLARTIGRRAATSTAALAVAAAVLVPAGVAAAAPATPAGDPAPSACRPANQRAVIEPAPASAGHRHYSVVLSAAPGTAPCLLSGSPSDLVFSLNGSPRASEVAVPYGDQTRAVEFGPGEPVAFDVQIRNSAGPATANELQFSLHGPGGDVPGSFLAQGPIGVDAGIQVGPVTAR